jgi:hypothetical protein
MFWQPAHVSGVTWWSRERCVFDLGLGLGLVVWDRNFRKVKAVRLCQVEMGSKKENQELGQCTWSAVLLYS